MDIKLSVIVIMCHRSADRTDSAVRTIRSVSEHYQGDDRDIRFVLVSDEEDTELKNCIFPEVQKTTGVKYNIICTDISGLDDIIAGSYILILEQGAVISEGDLARALHVFDKTDSIVFSLNEGVSSAELRHSGFMSVFRDAGKLSGKPYNKIIQHSSEYNLSDLVGPGAESMIIKMIVDGEGIFYCKDVKVKSREKEQVFFSGDSGVAACDLFSHSRKHFGYVCEYVQDYVLGLLAKDIDEHAHVAKLKEILWDISDEIIAGCRYLDTRQKVYLLSRKYSADMRNELYVSDEGRIRFRDTTLDKINAANHLSVAIADIRGEQLVLQGMTDIPYLLGAHYSLYASDKDDVRTEAQISPLKINDRYGFDNEQYCEGEQFVIRLPIKASNTFTLFLQSDNGCVIPVDPHMGRFSKLCYRLKMSYFRCGRYLVRFNHSSIKITPYSRKQHIKYELHYLRELISKKKYSCVFYRLLYYIDRCFKRKPIWIVMDRPHLAGDNGEHLFRYLQKTDAVKNNNVYFVLKKSSKDYERLKKMGKMLIHNSVRYKVKTLDSDFLISAAANELTTNAFGNSGVYYRDLCRFDFVYLRHGISHNDQSDWLHKLKKNIRILVSSCRQEYEGILNGDYGYTEHEVKLTGLARYDGLHDERKKIVVILPTWRQNLESKQLYRSSRRAYIKNFIDTDYYRFYNGLINNPDLLAAMKEHNFTGVMYMHPVFEAQYIDFESNDIISVGEGTADYQKVFRESAVMVTDYSSVAFDFAYLRKPIIYAQFDEDTFYNNHVWNQGYFSYRENGFGPVTNSIGETVKALIRYITEGCEMEPEYRSRADDFFAYDDRNNCERIYREICKAADERLNR